MRNRTFDLSSTDQSTVPTALARKTTRQILWKEVNPA